MKDRLDDIERIEVRCHNSSMVILDKTGPLHNFADRDHCMQYMIAVGMIFGKMTAEHYEDPIAADPRIDALRAKQRGRILEVCKDRKAVEAMPVNEFVDLIVP